MTRINADRSLLLPVDCASTSTGAADTTLVVRVQRRFVIDRDLFAGFYVAQRDEENVVVKNLHEGIRTARMVDIVSAISAAASVETPAIIDFTDSQHFAVSSSPRFGV